MGVRAYGFTPFSVPYRMADILCFRGIFAGRWGFQFGRILNRTIRVRY